MSPDPLSTGFQALLPLPTVKLGPSGAGSRVGGLVHTLGPCGSLQWPLLWGWESLLLPPQTPRAFSIRGLRLYFPELEHWVARSASLPEFIPFICARVWGLGVLLAALPALFSATLSPALSVYPCECGAAGSASGRTACPVRPTLRQSRSRHSHASPLHPGACLRPSYQSGWMFIISLVSDFLAIRFSVSSGCARRRNVSTYAAILVLQGSLSFPLDFVW